MVRSRLDIQFLYNDTDPSKDGLNLGASVYDACSDPAGALAAVVAGADGAPPEVPDGFWRWAAARKAGLLPWALARRSFDAP